MSLGEAFVTAHADTDTFLADLKRKLDPLLAKELGKVKLGVDIDHFTREMKAATRERAIEVNVSADTDKLRDSLAASTRDRSIEINVSADLDALQAQLDRATRNRDVFIDVKADVNELADKISSTLSYYREHTVFVDADVSPFERKLRATLNSVQRDIEVGVTVSDAALTALKTRLATLKDVRLKVDIEGLRDERLTVPVYGDLSYIKGQIADLLGTAKAHPIRLFFEAEMERVEAAINKLETEDVSIPIRPGNLRTFRKLVNDGLKKLAAVDIKLSANVPAFLGRLAAELRGKDTAPVEVKLTASTAALRAKIEAAFSRARPVKVAIDVDNADLGATGTSARELELNDAVERVTAAVRRQAEAFRQAGASERETLNLLRREIAELAARARELNIDVPVDIDSTQVVAELERAVEAAENTGRTINLPIRLDSSTFQAQLSALRSSITIPFDVPVVADLTTLQLQLRTLDQELPGGALEIPIHADLTVLRAQLAAFGSLGNKPIEVPITANLAFLRAQLAALSPDAIKVDIEARLLPGGLKELRRQAGRIASINVRADIDEAQFRTALIAAGAKGVVVKITPTGLVDFRKTIEAHFKFLGAHINVRPSNLVAFRQELEASTKTVRVPIHFAVANISQLRAEITAGLLSGAGLQVKIVPGNLPEFRRLVRDALRLETFPINIRPVITPADAARLRAQAGAAGDSAGLALGSRLNKAFSFAFGSLGRNFRSLERAAVGLAGAGEAAFVGIGVAGLAAASKIELLNISLENLATGTQATKTLKDDLLSVGQTVDQLKQKIIDFSLASPLGVDSVSDAVIRLTSSLKITGDQALEQIKLISGALAITPEGLNAEGLKGVVKALTQIAAAGKLGGQELLQLSNQIPVLSRTEIFTDLARQAVAAGIKIKGVTKDTKELTATQLAEVKKLQKAGTFGSEAALSAIFKSLGDVPGADEAIEKFNNSLTGKIQQIKETLQFQIGSLFLPIVTDVADGLKRAADAIGPALENSGFVDAFKAQFEQVVNIFIASIPGILQAIASIGKAFTNIFAAIGPEGFAKIGTTIAAVFDGIAKSVGPTIDFIRKAIEVIAPIVKGIIDAIIKAAPSFQPFISAVVKLAVAFGGFLKDVGGPVLQILGKALSGLAPIIEILAVALKVVGKVLGAVLGNTVVQKVLAFAASFLLLGGAIGKIGSVFAKVGGTISKALNFALKPLGTSLNKIGTGFALLRNLIFPLANAVLTLVRVALLPLRLTFGAITGAVTRLYPVLGVVGQFLRASFVPVLKFLGGALLGLVVAFKNVADAVKGGLVKALDLALLALQKIFEGLGKLPKFLGGGKFDGIADDLKKVREGLDNVTEGGTEAAASMDKFGAAGQQAALNVAGSIGAIDTSQTISNIDKVIASIQAIPRNADSSINVEISDALARIQQIRATLDAIPDKKSTEYQVAAQQAQGQIASIIYGLNQIPDVTVKQVFIDIRTVKDEAGRTSLDRLSLLRAGIDPDTTTAINADELKQKAQDAAEKLGIDTAGSIASGLSSGGSKGASAAETAAKRFKDKIQTIFDNLNEDLRKTLTEGTSTEVRKALRKLSKDIREAFEDAGKTPPSKLLARIASDNKRLQKLADQRDAIAKRLESAMSRAREIAQSARDFANIAGLTLDDVTASVTKSTGASRAVDKATLDLAGSFQILRTKLKTTAKDVVDANGNLTRALTGKDFLAVLKQRRAAINKFLADIEALRKRGLSKRILDELLSAGVETGGTTAAQLRNSSGATIKAINATQKGIDDAAKKLGDSGARISDSLAKEMAKSGEFAANGFVVGLQKQESKIVKTITSIVDKLIAAIRKRLKIASPSKVTTALAEHTGQGIVVGLGNKAADIAAQAQSLADAAMPNFRPISAPDMAALAKTQSMDVLANLKLGAVDQPKLDLEGLQRARLQVESNGGWTREDVKEMKTVLASIQGKRTEIHAPQTIHVREVPKPGKSVRVNGIF